MLSQVGTSSLACFVPRPRPSPGEQPRQFDVDSTLRAFHARAKRQRGSQLQLVHCYYTISTARSLLTCALGACQAPQPRLPKNLQPELAVLLTFEPRFIAKNTTRRLKSATNGHMAPQSLRAASRPSRRPSPHGRYMWALSAGYRW